MQLTVYGGSSTMQISDHIFACDYNESLLHQVVTSYMTTGRQGSKAQKTRAEVSGGGAKPWRQKGTGRARAGTTRGPLWRSGGVTFAAKPRNYTQKINKKMYRKGIKIILSELVRQNRLVLVDDIHLSQPKTKELAAYLNKINLNNALIVNDAIDTNLMLAARNLPNVGVCIYSELDPVSLISFDAVLITVQALRKLEEKLA